MQADAITAFAVGSAVKAWQEDPQPLPTVLGTV